jgi:hypothetical protein
MPGRYLSLHRVHDDGISLKQFVMRHAPVPGKLCPFVA